MASILVRVFCGFVCVFVENRHPRERDRETDGHRAYLQACRRDQIPRLLLTPPALHPRLPCELLHLARKARVEASFDEAEEHLDEAVALLARLRMLPGAVESGADIVDLEDENTRRARVELLHARALHELGEVRSEMGELDGAQDALVDAIDLFGRLRLRYDDGARSLGKYCQPNELYLADRRARSCLE